MFAKKEKRIEILFVCLFIRNIYSEAWLSNTFTISDRHPNRLNQMSVWDFYRWFDVEQWFVKSESHCLSNPLENTFNAIQKQQCQRQKRTPPIQLNHSRSASRAYVYCIIHPFFGIQSCNKHAIAKVSMNCEGRYSYLLALKSAKMVRFVWSKGCATFCGSTVVYIFPQDFFIRLFIVSPVFLRFKDEVAMGDNLSLFPVYWAHLFP